MRKKTTPKKKVIPKKTSSKKTSYKKTSSKKITPKKKVTTQRRKKTVLTKIKNVFDDINTLLPGESALKEPDQYKSKIK